jgi:hypothetical protein
VAAGNPGGSTLSVRATVQVALPAGPERIP